MLSSDFLNKKHFPSDFLWGVSTSAYQTEGAYLEDGKGLSIWDTFVHKNKIRGGETANDTCDFYHRYESDLALMKSLGLKNFRFSLSWSRIMPYGKGEVNAKGLAFYDELIDTCLSLGITPWVTLYHWDLPQALEDEGGWTNREIIHWFKDYTQICVRYFGDRVKHWMVMNEPMVFVGAGYFLGAHAPGRTGMKNFLPAIHHAVLAMTESARLIKFLQPQSIVGTTFSCSYIEPYSHSYRDVQAAQRVDALLNRMFIEPTLGLGYPVSKIAPLRKIYDYFKPGDEDKLKFDFDFIGIQNYTREVVKHSWFTPYLQAKIVKAENRKVPITLMNWEVFPPSIYEMIMKFNSYEGVKRIIITENGASFHDDYHPHMITDEDRVEYLKQHIAQVQRAIMMGAKVDGYFVWTWTDNFEWAEGYYPRFGLVYTDFKTQQRVVKKSGIWYGEFINSYK
jgi:beta-glucosidase